MLVLDCIVQPHIDPVSSVATDLYFMKTLGDRSPRRGGFLRIYGLGDDTLVLGRYHVAPEGDRGGCIGLSRRLTGGRPLPYGEGFVCLSLILPHRSALMAEDPLALRPEQVLNRCVRGVLETCRRLGVSPIYPGRDLVTVNRRMVAAISLTTDERGVLLFEACLAVGRDFGAIPDFLDAVDPTGVVKAEMLTPDQTTCLAAETGAALPLAAVAATLCEGYGSQSGVQIQQRDISAAERAEIATLTAQDLAAGRWVNERRRRPDLGRHVTRWTQLGALEAYLALGDGPTIRDIVFAGDFIANPAAIAALENGLRSCKTERSAIAAVVAQIFSQPENYLLGIGPLDTIAEMIVGGLR